MKKTFGLIISNFIVIFSLNGERSEQKESVEKEMIIVIPSYNNKKWYDKNLESALNQNYSNYRIIYTDDCSPDGTGELVDAYIQEHDYQNKVLLIKNNKRKGALYNLYTMIHMCNDEAVIVTLDGDDWFPDEKVLSRLNEIYSSQETWLTYGQFQLYPSGIIGWASAMPDYIVENNAFRDFQHLPTHLRTFYAWLFKKIKLEDLLYLGNFYSMTWDQAMMFPMIEMAGERHTFVSDIMYIYNDMNTISDHYVSRQLQAYLAQLIRKKERYARLDKKPLNQDYASATADVIIFAQNPHSLEQLLLSLEKNVHGIALQFVMYQPKSTDESNQYYILQKKYPHVEFILIVDHRANFIEALLNIYKKCTSDYILFVKKEQFVTKSVSINHIIQMLQETSSYAFYFNLNQHEKEQEYPLIPTVEHAKNIIAWNFALAQDKWSCANSLDFVLHKKSDALAAALQSHYDLTPNGLEMVWANEGNLDKLGLCFQENVIGNYERK